MDICKKCFYEIISLISFFLILFSCNSNSDDFVYRTKFYPLHYDKEMPLNIACVSYDDTISVFAEDGAIGKVCGILTLYYWDEIGQHVVDNLKLIDNENDFLSDMISRDWFCIGKDAEGRLFVHVKENNSGMDRHLLARIHAYSERKQYRGDFVPHIRDFELYQAKK